MCIAEGPLRDVNTYVGQNVELTIFSFDGFGNAISSGGALFVINVSLWII